jgi:hypothetical protein
MWVCERLRMHGGGNVTDKEDNRWMEVAKKLADLSVDSAVRAKVAADIREEFEEASGELGGTVHAYLFDRIRMFMEECQSAERLLAALGMPLYPIDQLVITEEERQAVDDLRGMLQKMLRTEQVPLAPAVPTSEAHWYVPGGVIADVLKAVRSDPDRWWTVSELAERTSRCVSSIYGKRGVNALVEWGYVVERRVQSEQGVRNQKVRQFKVADPQGERIE